jgi:hypothetical protein
LGRILTREEEKLEWNIKHNWRKQQLEELEEVLHKISGLKQL